jgi:hypothetical protein
MGQLDVPGYVREIDRERARLRKMLLSKDAKVLARWPNNGDWSVVENVRHLLWAEQLHLGTFLPDGFEWSRMGMTAYKGRRFSDVGTAPTTDVEQVFEEWDAIHKPIRRAVKSAGGDVEKALLGNHRHLGIHIQIIEKLLAQWDAGSKA